jgi:hypothetical protein
MEIFIGWFLFSIVVGVAGSSRGRSGAGWFMLALIISPLFAGLLVLALPSLKATFRPDGMLGGQTPFRTMPNGEVEAMVQGAPVRFRNVAEMKLMLAPGASIVSTVPPARWTQVDPYAVLLWIIGALILWALVANWPS